MTERIRWVPYQCSKRGHIFDEHWDFISELGGRGLYMERKCQYCNKYEERDPTPDERIEYKKMCEDD